MRDRLRRIRVGPVGDGIVWRKERAMTRQESWDWEATSADGQIRSYRDLRAWQKGREIVKLVYETTRTFPREENYGLTQQVRRAAVSVPSNIAEGYGRGSLPDYLRFLHTARGSLYETETQLILAYDLSYLAGEQTQALLEHTDECSRVLQGLIASLQRKQECS